MKVFAAALLCAMIGARLSWAEDNDSDSHLSPATVDYLMKQMEANQARLDKARGNKPEIPLYQGLPETVNVSMPEDERFLPIQHMPDNELAVETKGLLHPSDIYDVVDEDEWVFLPAGTRIRRDRSRGYEVWHYPEGMRLIHRIYRKTDHKLIEFRLEQKLADEAQGDGQWVFGIYRPINDEKILSLYKEDNGQRESLSLPQPGSTQMVVWTRLHPSSCRDCHATEGDGWYQYSDKDHAGPCDFVPKNAWLLAHLAKLFIGP